MESPPPLWSRRSSVIQLRRRRLDKGGLEKLRILRSVLNRREKQVISVLQEINLVDLSRKLVQSSVLVNKIRNEVSNIDINELDRRRGVRYLLKTVHESMSTSEATWDRFIDFLGCLGYEGYQVSLQLQQAVPKHCANCPILNSYVSSARCVLQESDIPELMKVLTPCNYKWEKISIALGLPRYVIEECRSGNSNVTRLYEMLHRWIVERYRGDCSLSPSLTTLELALSSSIVCESKIAQKLAQQLTVKKTCTCHHKWSIDSDSYIPYSPGRSSSKDRAIEILHQSNSVEVNYCMATVLAVEVSLSNVFYRWYEDGSPISSKHNFFNGADSDILYLREVTDSGRYVCCITDKLNASNFVKSSEIVVSVVYPPKHEHLTNLYSQLPEIPNNPWPPVSTSTFISLALINQNRHKGKPYTYVVNNSVDDILNEQVKIEFQDVFGKFLKGALLFVEGRPGSGKTTLVHKVARDWATNQRALRGATMVYLVSLRMLNSTEKDKNLFDILRPFFHDDEDTRAALVASKDTDGKGVCFILDGLDEYAGNNKENVIQDLIYKKILPLSMVIVASRPIGISVHRKANVTKEIEVVGFTNQNISSYINEYPFQGADVASELMKYLSHHDNVHRMCYLPVHSSMVCYLYDILGDAIPLTETKIYEHFTCLTILRTLKRDSESHVQIHSLKSLKNELQEYFIKICELAFDMTKKSVQVISQSDTSVCLHHSSGSDAPSLGLIVMDSTARLYGYEAVYTFLHLTFQEFLAAYYVSRLEASRQLEEITFFSQSQQEQVMKFYCGLAEVSDKLDQFKIILGSSTEYTPFYLQCAFESQCSMACDVAVDHATQGCVRDVGSLYNSEDQDSHCLYLSSSFLRPSDSIALAYVMLSSTLYISKLIVYNCYFDEETIQAFLTRVKLKKLGLLKVLSLKNEHDQLPMEAVNCLLKGVPNLEVLDFENAVFTKPHFEVLTKGVVLNNLKKLSICVSPMEIEELEKITFGSFILEQLCIGDAHASSGPVVHYDGSYQVPESVLFRCSLFHIFKKKIMPLDKQTPNAILLCSLKLSDINFDQFPHCASYSLINCGIGDDEVAVFTAALKGSTHVQLLCLDINNITGTGAVLVADLLRTNTGIKIFSAKCNYIDDDGAIALAKFLNLCTTNLQILDLQCNRMSDEGAVAIASSVKQAIWSLKLYLWNEKLSEAGISEILKYRCGAKMSTVYLKDIQPVAKVYPEIVVESIKYFQGLDKFIFSDIFGSVVDVDIIKIMRELRHVSKVKVLSFEGYKLGPFGALALVDALKHCSVLEVLSLQRCKIRDSGLKALVDDFKSQTLKVLNLKSNGINSDGVISLASRLCQYPSLVELNLADNAVTWDGLQAMGEEVKPLLNLKN